MRMMALDFDPVFRLKKRLDSLKRTHDAGVARSAFLTERNYSKNRQLMESLIHRLHSVESKAKRPKRERDRTKASLPEKLRPIGGKSQMLNPDYLGFHNKSHTVKRMYPSDYCDNSDSNLLKDLKELPPLHPSQVETVLRKKDVGSRHQSQKGEPIFPPPSDPSCSLSARAVVNSAAKSSTSNMQRVRKGSQSFNQSGLSTDKYSIPSTSCMNNFAPNMRPGVSTSLVPDSYPYADLSTKYDPDFYQKQSSCYDQLPGFSSYYGFNSYAHAPGQGSWPSLGKYDQNISGRLTQPSSSSLTPPDSTISYRANYPVTTGPENPPGFTTNLPFNQPFQSDNFMQSYPTSIDPQQPSYGMNLPSYSYPPPNTTSYM